MSGYFPSLVRSGISKHLMALRDAQLVYATRVGRKQYYRIHPQGLAEWLQPWVGKYSKYWGDRLEQLRKVAEELEGRTLPRVDLTSGPLDDYRKQQIAKGIARALTEAGLPGESVVITFRQNTGKDSCKGMPDGPSV